MLLRDADTAFNRYLTAQLAVHGVTFGQFQHLRNLWVENGLTQAELSRRIGIEMASSTAILDCARSRKAHHPRCATPPTAARSTSF